MPPLTFKQGISVIVAPAEKRSVISHLSQLYQHDMAVYFECSVDNLPSESGLYDPLPYLDRYWMDDDRFPFLILWHKKPVGFVLVNRVGTEASVDWNMAEFFIIRACREKGIGHYVAQYIIKRFSGIGEVAVIPENRAAYRFWKNVLEEIFPAQKACVDLKTIETPKPHKMYVFRIDKR